MTDDANNINDSSASGRKDGARTPNPVTAERLRHAALYHIERFATTEARLRQALGRKIAQSVRLHGTDANEAGLWVDNIVAGLRRLALLDDASWAKRRAARLSARGLARARIRDSLRAAGISAAAANLALDALGPAEASESDAAWAFARRRRLGPFRPRDQRARNRAGDLARLGRGGFSYETARAVIDAPGDERMDGDERADGDC